MNQRRNHSFGWFALLGTVSILCECGATYAAEPLDVTERFNVPDGFEVTVWAQSPLLFNPTNIDVDVRGRIWVAQAVNYRVFRNNQPTDDDYLHHAGGDRIMILEDTDHDGVADSSRVFVEDTDLVAPMGLSVIGNKVFVSCSPHLLVYTDDDGDDRPDSKELFLTGFGGQDHDHSLHTLVAGPDGRYYFDTGNTGPHIVKASDGWTMRAGSSYRGGSPSNSNNKAGLVSDDGQVYVGGVAVRINPDGTGMRVIGHNFRNPYELCLDSFGNVWQNDNDDTISCRTTWLMEGGNLGFASNDGTRTWKADQRPGQSVQNAHWRQDNPGSLPAGDVYGSGAPTGICYYENGALGDDYRGMLLSCDAGRNSVWGYFPKPQGAGFELAQFTFLSAKSQPVGEVEDFSRWFRPADIAVGTDGVLYVADWFDPFVGGHRQEDSKATGTIYRIAPRGFVPKSPTIDMTTLDGQVAALSSPAVHVRNSGFEALKKRGESAVGPVSELIDSSDQFLRARAVWLLPLLGPSGLDIAQSCLADDDPNMRITALRAMRAQNYKLREHAIRLAGDESPAVRREAALALKEVADVPDKVFLQLFDGFDGADKWYLEAFAQAARGRRGHVFALTEERFGAEPLEWSDAFSMLAWRFHPPETIAAFSQRALADQLPLPVRRQAIDALAFIHNIDAAHALLDIALDEKIESPLREYAGWWIRHRRTNDWKAFNLGDRLKELPTNTLQAVSKASNRGRRDLQDDQVSEDQKRQIIGEMAQSAEGGAMLLHMTARREIPDSLLPTVAEHIFRNPDFSVRTMASQFFTRPGAKQVTLPPLKELARLPGDVARGRELFFGEKIACGKCHKFGEKGGDVGPELTRIATKFDRQRLLDSIVNPSAAILVGYESHVIATLDGRLFTGLLLGDADPLILKDANGKTHTIPLDSIDEQVQQKISLMPEDTVRELEAQQLADLAEFLMAGP